MLCVECGARVPPRATHCPSCGAQITPTAPTLPTAATRPAAQHKSLGLPADRYVPSQYGPPVLAERSPYTLSRPAEVPRVRRPVGYRPIVPPPPPPPRRRGGCARVALVSAILLVGAVVAVAALGGRAGKWQFGPLGVHSAFVPTATLSRSSATAVPACAVSRVDASAATRLSHAQMTTALQDVGKQDYRPRDNVTAFHVGRLAYITFELATPAAGTVGVTFCTPHGDTIGTLQVPAGSTGRYGEFSTGLDSADLGQGTATLTWDGAVAAVVRFTVAP